MDILNYYLERISVYLLVGHILDLMLHECSYLFIVSHFTVRFVFIGKKCNWTWSCQHGFLRKAWIFKRRTHKRIVLLVSYVKLKCYQDKRELLMLEHFVNVRERQHQIGFFTNEPFCLSIYKIKSWDNTLSGTCSYCIFTLKIHSSMKML